MKGRYPVAIFFIDVPSDRIDVNIHPAKREVRFRDQQQVHEMVRSGIRQRLLESVRRQGGSTLRTTGVGAGPSVGKLDNPFSAESRAPYSPVRMSVDMIQEVHSSVQRRVSGGP